MLYYYNIVDWQNHIACIVIRIRYIGWYYKFLFREFIVDNIIEKNDKRRGLSLNSLPRKYVNMNKSSSSSAEYVYYII